MTSVAIGDTDIWCACPECKVYDHHLIAAHLERRHGEPREVRIVDGAGRTLQVVDTNLRPAMFQRECRSCGHVWHNRPDGP